MWNQETKQTNHGELIKYVKGLTFKQRQYAIKDCNEAIEANPGNPKIGHYMDTIHYCVMANNNCL